LGRPVDAECCHVRRAEQHGQVGWIDRSGLDAEHYVIWSWRGDRDLFESQTQLAIGRDERTQFQRGAAHVLLPALLQVGNVPAEFEPILASGP
jgi:hypothetical protein